MHANKKNSHIYISTDAYSVYIYAYLRGTNAMHRMPAEQREAGGAGGAAETAK